MAEKRMIEAVRDALLPVILSADEPRARDAVPTRRPVLSVVEGNLVVGQGANDFQGVEVS